MAVVGARAPSAGRVYSPTPLIQYYSAGPFSIHYFINKAQINESYRFSFPMPRREAEDQPHQDTEVIPLGLISSTSTSGLLLLQGRHKDSERGRKTALVLVVTIYIRSTLSNLYF